MVEAKHKSLNHLPESRPLIRLVAALAGLVFVAAACGGSSAPKTKSADTTQNNVAQVTSTAPIAPTTVAGPPSDQTMLAQVVRITGNITPKSVVASPAGLVSAQSMMYTHVITYYDPVDHELVASVSDSVDLDKFGISGHPGTSKGAPVEAVFTADGAKHYVSNYSMYGNGFGPEGSDQCTAGDGTETSYVYRIDVATEKIDQVIPVGAVPKYIAITPDQSKVLVTNWCSWDLSVIDVDKGAVTETISLDRYPRGIAVSPDSNTAYIAMMGANYVAKVDLASGSVSTLSSPGQGPRHIVISPDGEFLYVTNNTSGTVAKIERETGDVVATVSTGSQPRSMDISTDGLALYVVNYDSSTMTKLATSDLSTLATVPTDYHPIGIAYEPTTRSVWVACYGGSIIVFSDTTKI